MGVTDVMTIKKTTNKECNTIRNKTMKKIIYSALIICASSLYAADETIEDKVTSFNNEFTAVQQTPMTKENRGIRSERAMNLNNKIGVFLLENPTLQHRDSKNYEHLMHIKKELHKFIR